MRYFQTESEIGADGDPNRNSKHISLWAACTSVLTCARMYAHVCACTHSVRIMYAHVCASCTHMCAHHVRTCVRIMYAHVCASCTHMCAHVRTCANAVGAHTEEVTAYMCT
eukprot:GHVS01049353.1.p3 GENE.GHVS01049353.1~~GHVS01049353.1.p3  ORF type:complete len:111 (-),score=6.89 GHVS01049353.1:768-1100(-)